MYDVYRISHMKEIVFGTGIMFRYPGKIIESSVGTWGHNSTQFIKKIKEIQKGNFE